MGRRKLPMNLISKKRARLVCFEKRKKGLKKAAHELSTLCGVDVGMIIYDRDSNESEICGTTSLARMTQLYDSRSAHDRRCTYTVADYVKEEMEKARKMREKAGRDECGRMSLHQMRELGELLDARIAAVRGKIGSIKIKTEAADDHHVFLNQESGLFLNPSHQESGVCMNGSFQETGLFLNPFLNQESGVCMNGSLQETGLFLNPFLNQESGVCMNGSLQETGLFLNPFLNQESGVCFNQDQQQAMLWGNSSLMQEGLYFMADDVYGNMPADYEGSEAWGNSGLMQETNFYLPETAVEQQQIDLCNNMQDLVNPTMMNQSVEGTQNFMPGVIQQQAYQSNMGI